MTRITSRLSRLSFFVFFALLCNPPLNTHSALCVRSPGSIRGFPGYKAGHRWVFAHFFLSEMNPKAAKAAKPSSAEKKRDRRSGSLVEAEQDERRRERRREDYAVVEAYVKATSAVSPLLGLLDNRDFTSKIETSITPNLDALLGAVRDGSKSFRISTYKKIAAEINDIMSRLGDDDVVSTPAIFMGTLRRYAEATMNALAGIKMEADIENIRAVRLQIHEEYETKVKKAKKVYATSIKTLQSYRDSQIAEVVVEMEEKFRKRYPVSYNACDTRDTRGNARKRCHLLLWCRAPRSPRVAKCPWPPRRARAAGCPTTFTESPARPAWSLSATPPTTLWARCCRASTAAARRSRT